MRKTGRPSNFTRKLAEAICARLAGGESLRTICQGKGMPNRATVFRWLADPARADFRDQYARAREQQADYWAEEILSIADTPQEGVRHEESDNEQGSFSKTVREDMLGHRRLRVDARKWLLSKLAPKKYGDRLELAGDPNSPIITRIEQVLIDPANSDS